MRSANPPSYETLDFVLEVGKVGRRRQLEQIIGAMFMEVFGHNYSSQYPSVPKSNRLHVDIFRFSFIKSGYIV